MKKSVLFLTFFCSAVIFGAQDIVPDKKAYKILSAEQDIKDRLQFLKKKEIYITELENKINKKNSAVDLDKKYEKLEKKYLKGNLNDLDSKKEFLEFEKSAYEELLKRAENIERKI